MRTGFPGGPRLEWYDRNPIERSINYRATDVAPHASTQRASYTVGSGKKALLSVCYAEVERATAATTVGRAATSLGTATSPTLQVSHRNNTVGAREWGSSGVLVLLKAGDSFAIATVDLSTGGTMDYGVLSAITEIDA